MISFFKLIPNRLLSYNNVVQSDKGREFELNDMSNLLYLSNYLYYMKNLDDNWGIEPSVWHSLYT